ncbi:MAG TPA: hypothetical protein VG406_23200 [Isosphaeraceae bacterium]|jgi:hypothetical protein|nr:hypothetical protein [Isosphaeraceae bacterium]
MPTPLIPQAFWFRVALPCRRVDAMPRPKGRLLDLPADCALAGFDALEGRNPWAEVRAAWNPDGLALAVEVPQKLGPIATDPNRPEGEGLDGAEFWVDTRDTRDVHRATRFCHRFRATITSARKGDDLAVDVTQAKIARAQADAPTAPRGLVRAAAERHRKGWRLEMWLPAAALHGFDPETNRRLGFNYLIHDPNRDTLPLTVGREFPIGEDPSLWATLELVD